MDNCLKLLNLLKIDPELKILTISNSYANFLLTSEVTNVFWKYQKMADVSFLSCEKGIEQALSLPDDFINELDLYREAFKLGCAMNYPIYDMLYLCCQEK